ncbi:MAG: FABP family protein [Bifidobacteriaceae bacterium]|jgi:hypothetical protein|nr:FABP family protein [Bifidobacteriaceae bacterium]
MTALFAANLPPEVYPFAWLAGTWRGQGSIGYGPIPPGQITQELVFTAGQGPYLAYSARTWLLPSPTPPPDPAEPPPPGPATSAPPAQLWHEESGFWRVIPGQDRQDPPFEIEALIADAAGFLSLYAGQANGPRIDLGTDTMVRTASAAPVGAATRMYGLVRGELLWAWDIAGFGAEMGSYMAARLKRAAP